MMLARISLCPDFPVILFQWLGLKAIQLCTLTEFLQCAPSDDWSSLGLPLYSFIILTGFVSIDTEKENHTFFVGSCLVSLVFSSRTGCTERTLSHPHCAVYVQGSLERLYSTIYGILLFGANLFLGHLPGVTFNVGIDATHKTQHNAHGNAGTGSKTGKK